MYEGGVRTPLAIRWPDRIAPGRVCRVPVTTSDFYPTLLEAAGVVERPEVDGVSLMPLLTGADEVNREAIF